MVTGPREAERAGTGIVKSDWLYTMELGEVKSKGRLPEGL